MKPVVVSPQAEKDIEATAAYYEGQEPGLGAEFSDRVLEALDRIKLAPEGFKRSIRICAESTSDSSKIGLYGFGSSILRQLLSLA
jgi:hypothetical protein